MACTKQAAKMSTGSEVIKQPLILVVADCERAPTGNIKRLYNYKLRTFLLLTFSLL